ncbi:hypothetical protein GCM10027059_12580 [Myceligenerans halotolerans]
MNLRQPRGAPDSTGGQFAPAHRTDTDVPLPAPAPGATPQDVASVQQMLQEEGELPVADHRGHVVDENFYWTDRRESVAHAATRTLLGHDDNDVARLVGESSECFVPDREGIGSHFDARDLADAVRWFAHSR